MGFALPIIDAKCSQNILDSGGNLYSSTVASELVHCSPFTDDVFKGIDKFTGGCHAKNIDDKRFASDKDLGVLATTINSRNFGLNGVGGDRFMAPSHIEGGVGRLESHANMYTGLDVGGMLGSVLESLLDLMLRNM